MKTWIALLRGINVVGKNKVPMRELAAAFGRAGFQSVRTRFERCLGVRATGRNWRAVNELLKMLDG